jgi:AcrR family transcriptional regulator
LEVFAEKGFAAAKLDEIAQRAGVSKAALYRYFETKEELFRAVARATVAPNLEAIEKAIAAFDRPFAEVVPMLLSRMAAMRGEGRGPAMAKMVIGESRSFPDLARIWHDDVVARMMGMIADIVAGAQGRGEVIPGDPRLYAFSIMGPMVMALLFREIFGEHETDSPDLHGLAIQHAKTVVRGLLRAPPAENID